MKRTKIIARTATLALTFCACAGCSHKRMEGNTLQEMADVTVIGTTEPCITENETAVSAAASTESAERQEKAWFRSETKGEDDKETIRPETEDKDELTNESQETEGERTWEDPFSFQIAVNDVILALPAPAQQMLEAGFAFPVNVEETLEADSTSTLRMESESGARIMVTLANTTSKALPLKDCTICFLMADQSSTGDAKIAFPGEITYGTQEKEVRKIMAVAPNEEQIDDGVTHLTYQKNGDPQAFADWMEFQFSDGFLTAILIQTNAYGGYQP